MIPTLDINQRILVNRLGGNPSIGEAWCSIRPEPTSRVDEGRPEPGAGTRTGVR